MSIEELSDGKLLNRLASPGMHQIEAARRN
jgi:hypothetical protein